VNRAGVFNPSRHASLVIGSLGEEQHACSHVRTYACGNDPALDAFASAWAAIGAYRATLLIHETSGTSVEDRTYAYTFAKPTSATIAIVRGPGRGGHIAWNGGDGVTGSAGGFLSAIKLHLPINDRRVTTLRGDTVVMASFGWLLDHFRTTPGTFDQKPGHAPTDPTQLTLSVSDADADGGITREVVSFSPETKLPVRVERYIGSALVKDVRYSDVVVTSPATVAPAPTRL